MSEIVDSRPRLPATTPGYDSWPPDTEIGDPRSPYFMVR